MDIQNKKKIGLVLSGGGIKAAAFHIGVCLALKEKGFKFAGGSKELVRQRFPGDEPKTIRLYVGSSAGSFISSILAAGYDPESLVNAFNVGQGEEAPFDKQDLRYLKPLAYRNVFRVNGRRLLRWIPDLIKTKVLFRGGFEAFIKSGFKLNGLFTTKGVEAYLRKDAFLENDFSRLGVELYIVASELNHSRKALFGNFSENSVSKTTSYFQDSTISDAVSASCSLPPFFAPYGIKQTSGETEYFYDGEIRETLSAHVAADHGCDLVISSYSVQPYHFTPEVGSLHTHGIPVILNQALYQVIEQKISKHIDWQNNLGDFEKEILRLAKKEKWPAEIVEKIISTMQSKLHFKPNVDSIYIHPPAYNYEMFFVDHFSLNPKILDRIVRIGFKSALTSLRRAGL